MVAASRQCGRNVVEWAADFEGLADSGVAPADITAGQACVSYETGRFSEKAFPIMDGDIRGTTPATTGHRLVMPVNLHRVTLSWFRCYRRNRHRRRHLQPGR